MWVDVSGWMDAVRWCTWWIKWIGEPGSNPHPLTINHLQCNIWYSPFVRLVAWMSKVIEIWDSSWCECLMAQDIDSCFGLEFWL